VLEDLNWPSNQFLRKQRWSFFASDDRLSRMELRPLFALHLQQNPSVSCTLAAISWRRIVMKGVWIDHRICKIEIPAQLTIIFNKSRLCHRIEECTKIKIPCVSSGYHNFSVIKSCHPTSSILCNNKNLAIVILGKNIKPGLNESLYVPLPVPFTSPSNLLSIVHNILLTHFHYFPLVALPFLAHPAPNLLPRVPSLNES
jgi:hypothetical protein